ncbi:hypothetical protein ACWGH4_31155 [Streptomyces sp. NPDC054847]
MHAKDSWESVPTVDVRLWHSDAVGRFGRLMITDVLVCAEARCERGHLAERPEAVVA